MLQKTSKIWLNKLIDVLSVQTNSTNEKLMVLYLYKSLEAMDLRYGRDWIIDAAGNILVIKGKADTYPCVVSHMDTVHQFVNGFEVYKKRMHYYKTVKGVKKTVRRALELHACDDAEQATGIGGDDKCGVFACLYFLKTLPAVKVAFFSREEIGCRGSRDVNHDFFGDCRYIIQLDRRGGHDFITNLGSGKTISHAFSSELGGLKKEYGFKHANGSVTDATRLWDNGIGISCLNLSSGYHSPHCHNEYVDVEELFNAVNFTEAIIGHLKDVRYLSKPKPYKWTPTKPIAGYGGLTATSNTPDFKQCAGCLKWRDEKVMYMRKKKYYCFSCVSKTKGEVTKDKLLEPVGNAKTASIDTLYDCHGCKEVMIPGSSRRWRNGHFWCLNCVAKLNLDGVVDDDNDTLPDPEIETVRCSCCDQVILSKDKRHFLNGLATCDVCWSDDTDTLTKQTKDYVGDQDGKKQDNNEAD